MSDSQPVIELVNLQKTYHTGSVDVRAVRGVTLQVLPGEFMAIMGASGSGKSTLMNVMGCLDRPSGGIYRLDGVNVAELNRNQLSELRNRKIGFVFQGFNLLSRTSALENVELPMLYAAHAPRRKELKQRARDALARVGLGGWEDHHPSQLSGGQQQRVAVARALINQPALLLADEPTGNLDTRTSIEIMGIFQELNRQGMTIVMVTHELDIARYCLRQVVMRDGSVVSDQPVRSPLQATVELQKLKEEHEAIQLIPS